nr:MAG TPA: hypothetical protein [Caudoviricetes sp.]
MMARRSRAETLSGSRASRETAHVPSHTAAMPPAREVKSKNSE